MSILTVIQENGGGIVDYARHFHFSFHGCYLDGIVGHHGVPFIVLIRAASVVLQSYKFFGTLVSWGCSLYGWLVRLEEHRVHKAFSLQAIEKKGMRS
ncbi:hypothetical protein D3C73_1189920 [compost metagenome]